MFSPTENSAITASVCRSAGTRGMSSWARLGDVMPAVGDRREAELAARVGVRLPGEDVGQLQGAGSRQARDTEDLARPGLEVDAAQPLAVDPACLQGHGLVDLVDHARPEVGVDVVADHLPGEGPRIERADS